MTTIRKFLYSIAVLAAFVTLLQLPFAFAMSIVIGNPNNIDTALKQGGAYDNFVPLALEEASKNTDDANTKDILADQGIKDVIAQSIQPGDVQSAANSALGGIYAWLDGKTPQPEFKIDLSAPANRAANNLGAYAQKRATSLPPCTLEQMRTINFQEDLLSIPCLPLGVTPAQVGQQFSQQAKQQVDLLQNPVIDSKKLQQNGDAQDFSNSNLPQVYQNLHNSKWLTLAIAIISVALLIFARRNRWAGLKVTGILLLVVGGMLLVVLLAFTFGKGQVHADTKMNEVIINTVLGLAGQFFGIIRWFTLGYVVAGVASLIAIRKFGPTPIRVETPEKPADPFTTA